MNKLRLISALLLLVMLLTALAGCACQHEWVEANCLNPKTCTRCGATEGEKNDEHQWEDATTVFPKTCSVCGKREGGKIIVDPRFQTSRCKDLFGTWEAVCEMKLELLGLSEGSFQVKKTMTFTNNGKAKITTVLVDPEGLEATLSTGIAEDIYAANIAQGMDISQIDELFPQYYGMTVREFAAAEAKKTVEQWKSTSEDLIYYANEGKLYTGESWYGAMDSNKFEIEDGQLHLNDDDFFKTAVFTKISE